MAIVGTGDAGVGGPDHRPPQLHCPESGQIVVLGRAVAGAKPGIVTDGQQQVSLFAEVGAQLFGEGDLVTERWQ